MKNVSLIKKWSALFLATGITIISIWNSVFAASMDNSNLSKQPVGTTESGISELIDGQSKMAPDVVYGSEVSYKYDSQAIAEFIKNKSKALYKVECSRSNVAKKLGVKPNVHSIWFEEDGYDVYYDLRNCNLYGNKTMTDYTSKTLTEKDWLAMAQKFFNEKIATNSAVYSKVWAPVVVKTPNYPVAYAKQETSATAINDWIEIDESQNDTIEKEYQSLSITYPILIGGKPIHNVWWSKSVITIDVNALWVISFNIPMLNFKLVKKSSEVMTDADIKSFIKKWGQSPYYGKTTSEVVLKNTKDVYTTFWIPSNWKNTQYISTATLLESDVKEDWSDSNYSILVSDYKIGNGQ